MWMMKNQLLSTSNYGQHQFVVLPRLWENVHQGGACLVCLHVLPDFTSPAPISVKTPELRKQSSGIQADWRLSCLLEGSQILDRAPGGLSQAIRACTDPRFCWSHLEGSCLGVLPGQGSIYSRCCQTPSWHLPRPISSKTPLAWLVSASPLHLSDPRRGMSPRTPGTWVTHSRRSSGYEFAGPWNVRFF